MTHQGVADLLSPGTTSPGDRPATLLLVRVAAVMTRVS